MCPSSLWAANGAPDTQDTPESGKYLLFSNSSSQPIADRKANEAPPPKIENPEIKEKVATATPPAPAPKEEPVDLWADEVQFDEGQSIVTALGNVELTQAGRHLKADKITYNLSKDDVWAEGNIVLTEINGDQYLANSLKLTDKMKDGFVRGLQGALADGSRFTAENGEKVADLKMILSKATYTACEPCQLDPSKPPAWQIKARNVTHHKDEARISYDDATFEVAGVPVMYTPYFSHPDGSVKRKSGFLVPTLGFDSQLGTSYNQAYYWSIAPEKDATIGLSAYTDEAPLLTGEYRQRFEDAEINVNSGVTYSSRIDFDNNNDVAIDNKGRGHLFADGLWDINDKWRGGAELKLVSDRQYLRQYDVSNKNILENKLYLERFSKRNYATAELIDFKDVRTSDRHEDQPNVLPQIYTKFVGNPNATLGGRWDVEASVLGLHREGNEQDVGRASLAANWQKRHVTHTGIVSTLDLMARGDSYRVHDREAANVQNQRSKNSSAVRGFAQAHLKNSYPVAKSFKSAELVVEPIMSLTAGTNLNEDNGIPNEDSQDVFLDATNLFSPNRFPGYDRIEDEAFATYGVRTGLYGNNGYRGEVFFGQSYRFDEDDDLFPVGSGLSEQKSDFVGNVSIVAGSRLQLNYGMQLQSENFESQRHELDATGRIGDLTLNTRYFYANSLQGTDLDESREQVQLGGRYQLNDKWGVLSSMRYDLSEENKGLRYTRYGLDYQGQCVNFLLSGERRLTNDSSGDSGTQIMMRIGLKNLGEFETSSFTIGADDDVDTDTTDDLENANEAINQ